jgi:predicted transcriptional regulator
MTSIATCDTRARTETRSGANYGYRSETTMPAGVPLASDRASFQERAMAAGKQGRLAGMTPKHIEELQEKAEELKGYETERLDAQARESKARSELTTLMKEHKLEQMDLDDTREIVLEKKVTEEKAFVRRKKQKVGRPKKEKAEAGVAD